MMNLKTTGYAFLLSLAVVGSAPVIAAVADCCTDPACVKHCKEGHCDKGCDHCPEQTQSGDQMPMAGHDHGHMLDHSAS